VGLLLAWCAAGLVRETASKLAEWRNRRALWSAAAEWRFGMRQTDWLARCLAAADAAVEPGSRILLLARKEDFYRGRWAAYLLPAHHLLTSRSEVPPGTDLVVGLNGAVPARAARVGGDGRCALYRPRT
jgi:hypothetical protein